MKGTPKSLSTKQDYINLISCNAGDCERSLRALLDNRHTWQPMGEVESEGAGISDVTHKVVKEGRDGSDIFVQMELVFDANCKMERLGITEQEVQEWLQALE